jgi:hypothetical protein
MAAGLVVLLTLAGAAWGTNIIVHTCAEDLAGLGLEAGECVGVTDLAELQPRPSVFDPALADIEGRVQAENQPVAAGRTAYVKVALLGPLTSTDTSLWTPAKILHDAADPAVTTRANPARHAYGRCGGTALHCGQRADQRIRKARYRDWGFTNGTLSASVTVGVEVSPPCYGSEG